MKTVFLRQQAKTVPKRDDRITTDDDLEVDVFTILVDMRLGDIETTVFQQTFLEEVLGFRVLTSTETKP